MRVTRSQLRRIIREELCRNMRVNRLDEGLMDKVKEMFRKNPSETAEKMFKAIKTLLNKVNDAFDNGDKSAAIKIINASKWELDDYRNILKRLAKENVKQEFIKRAERYIKMIDETEETLLGARQRDKAQKQSSRDLQDRRESNAAKAQSGLDAEEKERNEKKRREKAANKRSNKPGKHVGADWEEKTHKAGSGASSNSAW